MTERDDIIASAIRLLNAGGNAEQVLRFVYEQARLRGLLEMARLADRLKQKEQEKRAA